MYREGKISPKFTVLCFLVEPETPPFHRMMQFNYFNSDSYQIHGDGYLEYLTLSLT